MAFITAHLSLRWLIEFDGFTREDSASKGSDQTSKEQPLRPLTESHLHNRPKWFEELSGRRRLSEIPAGMDSEETHLMTSGQVVFLDEPTTKTDSSISLLDLPTSHQESPSTLPTERKYSSEWLFLAENGHSTVKGNASRSSSSDSSMVHSPPSTFHLNSTSKCHGDKDDIFTMSNCTFSRSIEKSLRISEQPPEECIIPEMPCGSELTLTLLANWGDEHFIGLNGIEILDPSGKRPVVKNVCPLKTYFLWFLQIYFSYDKLLQIYLVDSTEKRHTQAELGILVDTDLLRARHHTWQYNLTLRKETLPLRIVIQLAEPVTIALLRIWNYNKSRVHSFRGVKFVQIKLNNQLIFSGEIAKASGELSGSVENFGDVSAFFFSCFGAINLIYSLLLLFQTILFTTSERILETISNFDTSFQELLLEQFQQVPLKF